MSQLELYNLSEREMDAVKTVLATRPEAIYQVVNEKTENEISDSFPSRNPDWVCSEDYVNLQAAKDADGQIYLHQQNYTDSRVFIYPENIADTEVSEEAVGKFESELEGYRKFESAPRWIEMLENHEFEVFDENPAQKESFEFDAGTEFESVGLDEVLSSDDPGNTSFRSEEIGEQEPASERNEGFPRDEECI